MPDVISGNGRIILDGSGVEDAVFYWLTISDEPGKLVAEGSISASEDLLRKVKKAKRATLALDGRQISCTNSSYLSSSYLPAMRRAEHRGRCEAWSRR